MPPGGHHGDQGSFADQMREIDTPFALHENLQAVCHRPEVVQRADPRLPVRLGIQGICARLTLGRQDDVR